MPERDHIMQFFDYGHLPPHLANVAMPFCELAKHVEQTLPRNPERTVALRKLLERHGAAPLENGDVGAWLARWLPALTRPLRHSGNHRYVWALDRRVRRHLPASLPYPKLGAWRAAA